MPETDTLEFTSARVLQSLYSNDDRLLRDLEQELDVRVTTRDGWLRVEGDPAGVQKTRSLFEQLEEARQNGMQIDRHEFAYALDAVRQGQPARLRDLAESRIECSPQKPPVVPKSATQREYVQAIRSFDAVFGIGPAGTGKTYLAMAAAVEALKKGSVSRIILTRPAVEAGEALGFLPGDLNEKISPYLRPLYDALYDMLEAEEIRRYMDRGVVEIAPLAYMRGRTLNHAFIILDEGQNTTAEQMFMFLTRLGAESKCVVTGDITQIDLPHRKRSGLVESMEILEKTPGLAFIHFDERDVIRHPLVQAIIKAYQKRRRGTADAPVAP